MRKYDGGALVVGTVPTSSHLILPPRVKDFVHAGHCSSECTSSMWPEGGIKVFGVVLHTHTLGRKIKVRHFRGRTELPWLVADDHYDFNYQQNIPYREHVQLLPGDQLVTECSYDTTEATHVGYSTLQEMCLAFFRVYPTVQDLQNCLSVFSPPEQVLDPLGIGSLNRSDPIYPIVTSPAEMEGLTLLDALNQKVNWTDEKIHNLQDQMRWKEQMGVCKGDKTVIFVPQVSYPKNFKAYKPKFTCQKSSGVQVAVVAGYLLQMTMIVAILVERCTACV